MSRPDISIRIITYQQANFISRCIESVLEQRTNYSFEICIGDDNSLDETREICEKYAREYPEIIKYYRWEKKEKAYTDLPKSRYNFLKTLEKCRGKYVAFLDGDDYWCNKNKLEAQIKLLEQKNQYIGCFTDYSTVNYEGQEVRSGVKNEKYKRNLKHEDVLMGTCPKTLTVVYNKNIIDKIIDIVPRKVINFDHVLATFATLYGDLAYLDIVSGSYRMSSGLWSKMKKESQLLTSLETYYSLYKSDLPVDDMIFIKNKSEDLLLKYLYYSKDGFKNPNLSSIIDDMGLYIPNTVEVYYNMIKSKLFRKILSSN